ncbi:MAG: response regulator [Bacteriovoracaceae bacterium]|nr:response regulator [Bacteriovoracaceae bacterium]
MILLLDNDNHFLNSYKTLLGNLGFKVIASNDPLEAIGMVRSHEISKVISSYQMETMDGVEFLENVKQINPDIKRVLLTLNFLEGYLVQEKGLNIVDSFVTKSIDQDSLIRAIVE